jgi:hypothetical protein
LSVKAFASKGVDLSILFNRINGLCIRLPVGKPEPPQKSACEVSDKSHHSESFVSDVSELKEVISLNLCNFF